MAFFTLTGKSNVPVGLATVSVIFLNKTGSKILKPDMNKFHIQFFHRKYYFMQKYATFNYFRT